MKIVWHIQVWPFIRCKKLTFLGFFVHGVRNGAKAHLLVAFLSNQDAKLVLKVCSFHSSISK